MLQLNHACLSFRIFARQSHCFRRGASSAPTASMAKPSACGRPTRADEQVGYLLGETIFMLKEKWYAPPTQSPNPRITLATQNAIETEKALRSRQVTISDPVQPFDDFYVGSFLDSEGNKIWFCSPVQS